MNSDMRKKCRTIWIVNHYASCPDYPNEHRHFDMAKQLVRMGLDVTIVTASTMHNFDLNLIEKDGPAFIEKKYEGINYVFLKTCSYSGNGVRRVLNMIDYLKSLNQIPSILPTPDVIYASSPHLLTLNKSIKLAKRLNVPCICEVRDLWPQSLIEYGYLSEHNPVARCLFQVERKAYENADALIFTMEGGADYIRDKGWDTSNGGKVDLAKVHHINNGIDLETFKEDATLYDCPVEVLKDNNKAKIVYAGSVRKANDIGFLVDVAQCMKDDGIEFVVLGAGDELEELRKRVRELGLSNITFPGAIDKKEIPASLEKAQLLLLYSSSQVNLSQYGMSQNKLFDYLASGKPVLSNLPSNYSIVNKYDCGIERSFVDPEDFANQIREMVSDKDSMKRWGDNARAAAELYSFVSHTNHLIDIIEDITKEEQ